MSAYKGKHPVPYFLRRRSAKPKTPYAPVKTQVPYTYIEQMIEGDSNCPVTTSNGMVLIGTSSKSGTANPNYKKQIADGVEAGTPYSVKLYFADSANAETRHWENQYYCSNKFRRRIVDTSVTNISGANFQNLYTDVQTDNIAIAKLRNAVNKKDKHTNALVPIVELRDLGHTVRSINDITLFMLSGVHRAVQTARHPSELVKLASDAWLTWSFGVKPMMSDAASIAESVAATLTPRIRTNSGSDSTKNWTVGTRDVSRAYGWSTSVDLVRSHYIELSYSYRVGLATLVESANNYAAMSEHLQLSNVAESFVPAIYELLPYSWLLDYFTTAGDVLSDRFETSPALRYGSKAVRYKETVFVQIAPLTGAINKTSVINDPGVLKFEHIYYNRSVFNSLPIRSFAFKTFDEIANHGVNKVLNLISILGSQKGGRNFRL